MDRTSLEIAKGSRGANCKFDAAFVKEMLSDFGLKPDFTANELLRVWKGCNEVRCYANNECKNYSCI